MKAEMINEWHKAYTEGQIYLDESPFVRVVSGIEGALCFFYTQSREKRLFTPEPDPAFCCRLGELPEATIVEENKIAFNTYPYKRYSLLILPTEHREQIEERDLFSWATLQQQFEDEKTYPRPFLFVNTIGAGATLPHIHAQIVFLEFRGPLWIEHATKHEITPNIFELEYSLFTLAFPTTTDGIHKAFQIFSYIIDNEQTACNISISQGEIRISPRRTRNDSMIAGPFLAMVNNKDEYRDKISGSEVNGLYSTTNGEVVQKFRQLSDSALQSLFAKTLFAIDPADDMKDRIREKVKHL